MILRPPRPTRTDALLPYTTLVRARQQIAVLQRLLAEIGEKVIAAVILLDRKKLRPDSPACFFRCGGRHSFRKLRRGGLGRLRGRFQQIGLFTYHHVACTCFLNVPEIHIRLPMFPFRSTRSIALEAWAPFIIFVRPIGLRIAKIRFSSRTNADERRISPSLRTTTCWVSVFIPAQELVPHLDKDARGKLCLMIRFARGRTLFFRSKIGRANV